MKRDSILPEKDVTSFFERCLSLQKRCYVFLRNLPTQLNIKITLYGISPLSILPSPFN